MTCAQGKEVSYIQGDGVFSSVGPMSVSQCQAVRSQPVVKPTRVQPCVEKLISIEGLNSRAGFGKTNIWDHIKFSTYLFA